MAEEKADSGDAPAAESEGSGSEGDGDEKGGEDGGKAADEKDKKPAAEDTGPAADASPVEESGKTYRFVGARYRLIVVPEFIIGLFADGGTTVAAHAFGPEFGIRKDGFEYNFGLWFAGYGMDPTPFKAKSDGEDAWELVESNIKVAYLTADFLWSHKFSPEFALNYGMGAGIGLVWGPLYRNQAYRAANGQFVRCTAQGPGGGSQYCGFDNNHYNNYEEPGWADGGSKPAIFPWLAVQTGLRYKPHRRFVGRLDVGFGLSGFFFGVGADYGI